MALCVLVALLAIAALLGGSSRPDASQLLFLRPASVLLLTVAILLATPSRLSSVRIPLILLQLLAGVMILQLVPLPPSVWQSLPGRELVTQLGLSLGMEEIWRPLSLTPSRTLNALFSLVVPAAALILLSVQSQRRRIILLSFIGIGVGNALLGLVQIGTGFGYIYDITNLGSPVGFFANRNHAAIMHALTLIAIARTLISRGIGLDHMALRAGLYGAYIVVLLAAITSGSRAGLVATIFATAISVYLLWLQGRQHRPEDGATKWVPALGRSWQSLGWVVTAMLLLGTFVAFDRIPALQRLGGGDPLSDLRWTLLPVLQEMIAVHWVFGSGFGSFEEVFHIYEAEQLLQPSYLNQAHNDWAQFLIEGGILSGCLLLAGGAALVGGLIRLALSANTQAGLVVFWLSAIAITAFASAVDYPLRAPLFQVMMAHFIILFCLDCRAIRPDSSRALS